MEGVDVAHEFALLRSMAHSSPVIGGDLLELPVSVSRAAQVRVQFSIGGLLPRRRPVPLVVLRLLDQSRGLLPLSLT